MDFRKYILEAQRSIDAPVTGDDFDFQINETLSIECQVVEHTDDTFVIGLDQQAWDILKEADLVSEAETCMECGMGTMYVISEGMRCDACGHTMTVEAAPPVHLERAREAGIDVRRDDLGDGYFLGHYVHDDGDVTKVSYNVYHLENPEGLTNQLVNAFRDVGNLRVSPYRAKPEEIKAAAAQMKINDMAKNATPESLGEAGFMDTVKGALGMGKKAPPPAAPAAAPAPKPVARQFQPGKYDFGRISARNSIIPLRQGGHHGILRLGAKVNEQD